MEKKKMKTMFLVVLCMPLLLFVMVSSSHDAYGLSCAAGTIQNVYDNADHVLYGKVISKHYYTLDSNHPVMDFAVFESLKGTNTSKISISVDERWDHAFEDGIEYVIFVDENGKNSFSIDPCTPEYVAFESIIDVICSLEQPNNEAGNMLAFSLYDKITEDEKILLEDIQDQLEQKRTERWNEIQMQRLAIIVSSMVLIPSSGVLGYVAFRKKRN